MHMSCCNDNTHKLSLFINNLSESDFINIEEVLTNETFYTSVQAKAIVESLKVTQRYTRSNFTESAIFSGTLESCNNLKTAVKRKNIESRIVKIPKLN